MLKVATMLLSPPKYLFSIEIEISAIVLWHYELWSFQTGDTKLERFLPKNQHTQRKLMNFEFWINDEPSNRAKI
jgi:hypothetical protein